MPIYAYKCGSCGHAKDVLQKLSDAPLAICPACGAAAFNKQVTAAGFQLKGSGWYATDFRGGAPAPAEGASKDAEGAKPADGAAKPADSSAKPSESASKPSEGASKPAESSSGAPKSDAPKASADGCASGSGCH